MLDELAAAGTTAVVVVPIAFTGEHIETLQEIDILYKERAEQAGIVHFARARTVGCHPAFIARARGSGRGDGARARLGLRAPVRVTIVGGGISGLTAAHVARRARHDVVLLDAGAAAPGGLIAQRPARRLPLRARARRRCSTAPRRRAR